MKRILNGFRSRLALLSGAVCCATSLATGSATAQESGGLESMQLEFPVQRIGSAQALPPVNNPTDEEYRDQYLQTSATIDSSVTKMSRRLANLTWERFEQKLVDLWGDRLQAHAEDAQGARVRILIPSDKPGNNQMIIDRHHNAVTFEGDPQVAENWDTLVDLLDRVENERYENVRLVGLGNATPATLRRAIGLLGIPEDESSSLSEALQFVPFRITAQMSEPQRRSHLRSIPFRPATNNNKKTTSAQAPRPRTAVTTTPSPAQPTPPRASAIANPTGRSTNDVKGLDAPTRAAITREAKAPSLMRPNVTQPAQPTSLIPAMTASNKEMAAPSTSLKATNEPVTAKTTSVPAPAITPEPATTEAKITAQPQPVRSHSATPSRTRSLAYSAPANPQEEGPRGMSIVEMQQDPIDGPQGPVKIRVVPELNAIVLIGDPEDVQKVKEMIRNIVSTAGVSQPSSKLYNVRFADSATLKATIDQIYEAAYATNNGVAEIIAINSPNSLMVVAQESAQGIINDLIKKLDIETPETDDTMDFRVFKLKHMSAVDAASRLSGYFRPSRGETENQEVQPGTWIASVEGLVNIVIDYRSNSVVVKGNQRVLRNAERILAQLDVESSETTHVVRFFRVYNTLAVDIANVLQNAINGQLDGAPQAITNGQGQALAGADTGTGGFGSTNRANLPVAMLKMTTISEGGKVTQSGILLDVKVTADANSNQLMITGPEKSMELIAALIRQLDRIPDAETQIKVFTILNGDANELLTTLQTVFGADQAQGGQGFGGAGQATTAQLPLQTASQSPGASLINLRFGVDARTNSIIASGPAGDLQVIEDLLNRLDEQDLANRINHIYKLSNAPAEDVALAINNWLDSRQEVVDSDPTTNAEFVSARRQVVVVEELISNSLIISASPAYFEEVVRLIQELDRRPPMVKIKVMLAAVQLNKLTEFGVEVGIQDSLLFDRGLGVIGFPFNQTTVGSLGNNSDALSLSTREMLAGQALSNLSIGRQNSALGYGGTVLSAGNESINVLIRALQDRSVARVMATPDIMTVENLQGRIQVGEKVPRVTGASTNDSGGTTTQVEDVDVGIILSVTPRVSPDGMIIMSVDAVRSELGEEEDGVPVFVSEGQVIRSPPIDIIQAQTTVMARSGQTVAFSGLIRDRTSEAKRGTPILSDLPVLGPLFSFESDDHEREELLIILTPYLVDNDAQIEASNQAAINRMNLCLADVAEVYGSGFGGAYDPENLDAHQTPIYYPDQDPTGENPHYLPLEGDAGGQPDQFPQDVFEQPTAPPLMPEQAAPATDEGNNSVGFLKRLVPGNSSGSR